MLKLFLKSIDLKTGKHLIIEQSSFCTGAKINRRTKNRQKYLKYYTLIPDTFRDTNRQFPDILTPKMDMLILFTLLVVINFVFIMS